MLLRLQPKKLEPPTASDGTEKTIFFDIGDFFGKF
jgi:hypothetical protein